ncbi:transposase family protein [Kitasatospora sp. NPDC048540]|uniref:transposase family protein n=1 Tax=Kitasatospora sp. NPDC048540 TaxID=3155634 RepID=UPI0033CCB874
MCRQSATVCLAKPPVRQHDTAIGLAERLRGLADPRGRRGRRHPFVSVVLIAASAVLAGARSYAAIGQWAGSAPQHTLARLGARAVGVLGVRVPPSRATIRCVLTLACPGGLAELTGADRPELRPWRWTARAHAAHATARCRPLISLPR